MVVIQFGQHACILRHIDLWTARCQVASFQVSCQWDGFHKLSLCSSLLVAVATFPCIPSQPTNFAYLLLSTITAHHGKSSSHQHSLFPAWLCCFHALCVQLHQWCTCIFSSHQFFLFLLPTCQLHNKKGKDSQPIWYLFGLRWKKCISKVSKYHFVILFSLIAAIALISADVKFFTWLTVEMPFFQVFHQLLCQALSPSSLTAVLLPKTCPAPTYFQTNLTRHSLGF